MIDAISNSFGMLETDTGSGEEDWGRRLRKGESGVRKEVAA